MTRYFIFLDKPSDVICYTVSPRGVGTHDVDEWLASWSPRVDMEKKSKKNRLQKDLEKLKNGEIVEKNGYYRNEHRFLPRSYLAKNILEEKEGNENGEEDSVISKVV